MTKSNQNDIEQSNAADPETGASVIGYQRERGAEFEGTVLSYLHDFRFRAVPVPTEARRELNETGRYPTHRIEVEGRHGKWVELGAAWLAPIRSGKWEGFPMLSAQIEDPNLKLRFRCMPDGSWPADSWDKNSHGLPFVVKLG